MAQVISTNQTMREAEIDAVNYINGELQDTLKTHGETGSTNAETIAKETNERENAFNQLSNAIENSSLRLDTEIKNREDADSDLSNRINTYENKFQDLHIHVHSVGVLTPSTTAKKYTFTDNATSNFYTDRNVEVFVPSFTDFVIIPDTDWEAYEKVRIRQQVYLEYNYVNGVYYTQWVGTIEYQWLGEADEIGSKGLMFHTVSIYDKSKQE